MMFSIFISLLGATILARCASSPIITVAPDLHPRQADPNSASCLSFTSFEEACASSTPGFSTLGPAQQYSCLCFTSSSYAPAVYQSYFIGCLSYLSTASPAYYASIGGNDLTTIEYCPSVSQELSTLPSVTITPGPPLAAPTASYLAACSSLQGLINSCAALTPSLTALPFSSQAPCLCGSSATSYPYDGYWTSCLQYLSAAQPALWTSAGGPAALTSPCAVAAGNLGSLTGLTTPTLTPASISIPAPTSMATSEASSTAATTTAADNVASSKQMHLWLSLGAALLLFEFTL